MFRNGTCLAGRSPFRVSLPEANRPQSAHCGPSVGVKDATLQPVDPDIDPSAVRHDACVSKLLSKPEYGMICLTDGAELLPPCSKCGGKLVPVRSHPSRR